MSAAPDPAELAPSRDPAAYGSRRLFTGGFAGWIVLCLICLAGGAAIGRFALSPAEPASRPAPGDSPARAAASPSPSPTATLPAALPAGTPATGAPVPDSGLNDRVARLEGAASRVSDAAAQALAAATLSTAAEGSAPFGVDVAAYARLAPGDPDLAALAPLAARGAPSRAALAAAFPDLASAAAAASRNAGKDAGYLAHVWAALGKVVIVRNVDPRRGGVDGTLARAQAAASAGDLAGAVRDIDALPGPARAALAEWRAAAEGRLEIDQRVDNLRARALAGLAQQRAAG